MNECILVVDDDPEIVNAIALPLQGDGDGVYNLGVVVNDQDAFLHGVNLPLS